ncbi:hypothetical protein J2T38_001820 [Neisseria perflava]|uniref:hypothetical protein n=1 Tax=Neisseria perflava TaxID=33053 RepID=UPI0020A007F3|nr:hypothetical protein [Neisseria perflava]MCP1772976.1 hypothetical protein [Neisseria perflava]
MKMYLTGVLALGMALSAHAQETSGIWSDAFPRQPSETHAANNKEIITGQVWQQRLTPPEVEEMRRRHNLLRKSLLEPRNIWPYRIQPFLRLDRMAYTLDEYEEDKPVAQMMGEKKKADFI